MDHLVSVLLASLPYHERCGSCLWCRKEACQQFKECTTQITSSFAFGADLLHPRQEATQKGVCTMSTEENKALARRVGSGLSEKEMVDCEGNSR